MNADNRPAAKVLAENDLLDFDFIGKPLGLTERQLKRVLKKLGVLESRDAGNSTMLLAKQQYVNAGFFKHEARAYHNPGQPYVGRNYLKVIPTVAGMEFIHRIVSEHLEQEKSDG